MSNASTLRPAEISRVGRGDGAYSDDDGVLAEMLFLQTEKSDGTVYPTSEQLRQGVVLDLVMCLVRADRFLAATKALFGQRGKLPSVLDAFRSALEQPHTIHRPMRFNLRHGVVADQASY